MTFKQIEKIIKPIFFTFGQFAAIVLAALTVVYGFIKIKELYIVHEEIVAFALAFFFVFIFLLYFNYRRQSQIEDKS